MLAICAGVALAAEVPPAAEPDLQAVTAKFKSLYQEGDYQAATTVAQEALRIAFEQHGVDAPEMAAVAHNLAVVLVQRGFLDDAEKLLLDALYNLASLYADMGRYEAAEPLLSRAVEAGDQVFGTDDRRARLMHDRLHEVRRHAAASSGARPRK